MDKQNQMDQIVKHLEGQKRDVRTVKKEYSIP